MIHLAFRYIKGYKKNTILSIMGIAFSVMLMFSLLQMGEMMLSQFRHMVGDYPTADFQIRNFDFDELDEIYSYLQKKHREYTFYKRAVYGSSFAPNGMTVITIEGVEGAWDKLPPREVLAGRKPEKYGEICVEKKYCTMLGKTPEEMVGEKLKLVVHDDDYKEHEITYCVSGVLSDAGDNTDSCSMQTTYETAVKVVEKYHFKYDRNGNQINMLYDKFSENSDRDVDLQMEIMNRFCSGDKYFYKDHIWTNPVRSEKFEGQGMYSDTSAAFGAIAAMISVCLVLFVYNMTGIRITEKMKQYGMMRCIGLFGHAMLRLMEIETLFCAVCGLVIGILAGKLLNSLVAGPLIGTLLNIEMTKQPDGIFAYLFTAALTIFAVVLAFLCVYIKVRKLKPIQMMHYTENHKLAFTVKSDGKEKKLLPVMAQRNLQRSKLRTRTLFSVFLLSAVILMVIVNAVGLIDFKSRDMRGHFSHFEVFSNLVEGQYISPDQIQELQKNGEVSGVYWQKFCNDISCTPDRNTQYGTCLYVFSDNLFQKFLELNKIHIPENAGIVISYDDRNYQCDNITLKYAGLKETDDTASYTLPVQEILYEEYGNSLLGGLTFSPSEGAYLIVDEKLAEKIYAAVGDEESLQNYTDILVDCTDAMEESSLYELFGSEVSVVDLKVFTDNTEGQLLGMGAVLVYILLAVMVLSVLIINSIIKTNVVNRKKEIGMMRSIGAEDVFIKKLLVKEMMIMAVKAVLAACLIAIPISLYLGFMMHDTLKITFAGYPAGAAVVLLGSLFLSEYAVKKNLSGKNISEMLRQE